jgi:hypothetical protein
MGKYVDLHLFMHLSFFLFFHLRSFLGVQVTAGRDSNNLVFEGFSRHIQKLSLCFSTRQPIPTMGWITCEWADDFMTPTWLKRHCVVLVASSLDFGFPFLGSCRVVSSQKLYGERRTTAFASFL